MYASIFKRAFGYSYPTNTTESALAIKGTDFNNPYDIADNVNVLRDKVPRRIPYFRKNVRQILELIKDTDDNNVGKVYDNGPLYLVGHSLGAIYAACLFAELSNGDGRIQCITFDNPGCKNIVKGYLKAQGWDDKKIETHMKNLSPYMFNIQADVNLINTCNEQWGNVMRVYRYYIGEDMTELPTDDISARYDLNNHYLMSYLYDQHIIANIIKGLEKEMPHPDLSPAGLAAGYRVYLDYNKRKNYWDDYIQFCWDNYPVLHKEYNNDFEHYKNKTINRLNQLSGIVELTEENVMAQERVKFIMNHMFEIAKIKDPTFTLNLKIPEKEPSKIIKLGR